MEFGTFGSQDVLKVDCLVTEAKNIRESSIKGQHYRFLYLCVIALGLNKLEDNLVLTMQDVCLRDKNFYDTYTKVLIDRYFEVLDFGSDNLSINSLMRLIKSTFSLYKCV